MHLGVEDKGGVIPHMAACDMAKVELQVGEELGDEAQASGLLSLHKQFDGDLEVYDSSPSPYSSPFSPVKEYHFFCT